MRWPTCAVRLGSASKWAEGLGATRLQLFRHVILPSAMPEIFTGMRVGIGVAWTCLVATEMIGAASGLGWLVQIAGQDLQVGVAAIGVLGYLMELGIGKLEGCVVPWRGRTKGEDDSR